MLPTVSLPWYGMRDVGLLLIFLGLLFILVGIFLSFGRAQVGGVVMVGPIPIPFGDARLALLGVLFGLGVFLITLLQR